MFGQFTGWQLSTVISIVSGVDTYYISHLELKDDGTGFEKKEEVFKDMYEIPESLFGRIVDNCHLSNSHPGCIFISLK